MHTSPHTNIDKKAKQVSRSSLLRGTLDNVEGTYEDFTQYNNLAMSHVPNTNETHNEDKASVTTMITTDSSSDELRKDGEVANTQPSEPVKVENEDAETGAMSKQASVKPVINLSFLQRMRYVVQHFWPLGLIAFGGPQAHIALLRERFVDKLKMIDDETFLELFGLCGALPGPTSTQLVIALATMQAGIPGGFLAYIMWSIPGFVILTVAGVTSGLYFDANQGTPNWMAGLGPAATAQVFIATWVISKSIAGHYLRMALCLFAAAVTIIVMGDARIDVRLGSVSFPAVMIIGGLTTLIDSQRKDRLKVYYTPPKDEEERLAMDAEQKGLKKRMAIPRWFGAVLIVVWIVVLVVVIVLRSSGIIKDNNGILFESMYRIGSIIYGGGQVVLPMMQQENYCSTDQFFQGFALVQALPGPLFNFSAFLGGVYAGVGGAVIALMGINLPGMLLTFGVLPYWARLRRIPYFKVFITGVTAAAIGLLYTACVQLYEAAIGDAADAVVFLFSAALSALFNVPVPVSIIAGSVLGFILSPGAIGIGQTLYCLAEFRRNNATFLSA